MARKVIHDHDIDLENDCVLRKMLAVGAPLTCIGPGCNFGELQI